MSYSVGHIWNQEDGITFNTIIEYPSSFVKHIFYKVSPTREGVVKFVKAQITNKFTYQKH